jgi:BirA family biotin operon repressor/biotin-[acetyl-CoA-carboxylase] ligase
MRLDPAATVAGFRLHAHDIMTSTNAEALTLAATEVAPAGPLWITARRQSAGRGRRGNVWVSPSGNLYTTLLLRDPAPPLRAPQLSFVAALAVFDAILDCAPGLGGRLKLKWPNDVLCGGAKLAGILIEGRGFDTGLSVAIGIGVNCQQHPTQTSYPATDLAAEGVGVAVDDLFAALSGAMLRRLTQWRRGEAFAEIRGDWLARAAGMDADMRVRLPDRELFGRCEALDDSGRLLLRLQDGGLEAITAGDVFPVFCGDTTGRRSAKDAVADGAS